MLQLPGGVCAEVPATLGDHLIPHGPDVGHLHTAEEQLADCRDQFLAAALTQYVPLGGADVQVCPRCVVVGMDGEGGVGLF